MKKTKFRRLVNYLLLLTILIPCLAFGKVAKQYDWYRVAKGFSGHGVFEGFNTHPDDRIYCYWVMESDVRIHLFDSKGKVKGWYWIFKEVRDKLENDSYCTWLENRKDNRYK